MTIAMAKNHFSTNKHNWKYYELQSHKRELKKNTKKKQTTTRY